MNGRYYRLEPCCAVCIGCDRVYCRDTEPSPGEESGICRDCFEQEDDGPEAA